MNTLNLDTLEWFDDDEIEVPEEHDMQELLYPTGCPNCTGDVTYGYFKRFGMCADCKTSGDYKGKQL